MAEVRTRITGDAKGLKTAAGEATKTMERLSKNLDETASRVSTLGTSLTTLAAPVVAAGAAALLMSGNFESSLLKIQNLVGVSAQEVAQFKEEVLELGGEVGRSPQELADALFAVTSAGAKGQEALDILTKSAKASAIGLGETREIALAVTAATTAYGAANLSSSEAIDTLVNTVKFGNLEASELAATLGRVTPIASQLGLSFQDTGAFIATFTRLGGDAAEATTSLRGILGALAKPGSDAAKALEEMGLSAEGLRQTIQEEGIVQALQQVIEGANGNTEALGRVIPNVRALTGVLATAGAQGEEFAAIQEAIRNGSGVLEEGFKNLEGTTKFTFDQVRAKISATFIQFGDAIAPAVLRILDSVDPVLAVIEKLIVGFSNLPGPMKTAAVAAVLFVSAMGPISLVAGQAIQGTSALIKLFPGLSSGVLKAAQSLKTFSPSLLGTATSAQKLTPTLGELFTSLKQVPSLAKSGAGGLLQMGKSLNAAVGAATSVKAGFFGVTAGTAALSAAAVVAGGVIGVKLGGALLETGDRIRGVNDPIREAVKQVGFLKGASSLLGEGLGGLINIVKNLDVSLREIPVVGAAVAAFFDSFRKIFDLTAISVSKFSDLIAEGTVGLFAESNAARDATVAQGQLGAASFIAGRQITDQAEALAIINKSLVDHARANEEAGSTAAEAAVQAGEDAAAKAASAAAAEAAAAAQKQFAEDVKSAAEALETAASAQQDLNVLSAALQQVGGVGALTGTQLQSLRDDLLGMQAAGVDVSGTLEQVDARLAELGLDEVSVKARELALELGLIPAADAAQQIEIFRAALQNVASVQDLSVQQGEALFQKLQELKSAVGELPPDLQALEAQLRDLGFDEAGKEVRAFVAELEKGGLAGAQKRVAVLTAGVNKFGGVAKLTAAQVKQLDAEATKLEQTGAELSGTLKEVQDAAAEGRVEELTAQFSELNGVISLETTAALAELEASIAMAMENGTVATQEFQDAAIAALDQIAADSPGAAAEVDRIKDEFNLASSSAIDFGSIIGDLSNIMESFGVDASSSIGQAIVGIQQLGSSLPALTNFQNSILGDKALSNAKKFQGVAGGVASGIAGIASATSSGGAGASAAKGALAGAQAGAQIGGPIGAGVGAAAGAIVGFFRGKGRDKIRKAVSDAVGADVSEDLSQAIKDAAKDAGRDIQTQSLLSLGDIFRDVGVDEFRDGALGAANAVTDLMSQVASGAIDAEDGVAAIGDAFGELVNQTFEFGKVADAGLIQLVKNARELGQEVPEIAAFVESQLAEAAQGITKVIGGIQIADPQDAQDQATIFAGAFFATLEEVGLLAAVDAFQPAFEKLKETIAEAGIEGVDFGGVERLFQIAGQEQFRPLLEGVEGLNQGLVGLANSGFLTQESFSAFQRQGVSAFEQLQAAGLNQNEALQQMAPFLQSAIDAAERFGIPLDANTQSLIAQAEAAGIAFETDPMNRMADALVLVAELLGATEEQLSGLGETAATTGEQVSTGLSAGFEEGAQTAEETGEFMIDQMRERNGVILTDAEETGIAMGEALNRGAEIFAEGGSLQEGVNKFEEMREKVSGVGEEIGNLPGVAEESVNGIAESFASGTEAITSGLDPVAEKMATEIRQAGEQTSTAIDASFEATNASIKGGLGEIAATFEGQVVAGALKAADATKSIAAAAREAAIAARDISFPGGGGGGPDVSAASGFNATLRRDTLIQAHAGERAIVIPRGLTQRMDFASAQEGFGLDQIVAQPRGRGGVTLSPRFGDVVVEGGGRMPDLSDEEIEDLMERMDVVYEANRRDLRDKLQKRVDRS